MIWNKTCIRWNIAYLNSYEVKCYMIEISDSAEALLFDKASYFEKKERYPRLVITERSCRGAMFRLFFMPKEAGDEAFDAGRKKIYVAPNVASEFDGFTISLERFFFARRFLISPKRQSYACDCDAKCNNNK